MDTLLVRHTLRGTMLSNISECEVCTTPKAILEYPVTNLYFMQTGVDSIWILSDPTTQQLATQSSMQLHIRREIHKIYNTETHSQVPSFDIVEEFRSPTHSATETMGGSSFEIRHL
jgi:hypothetical protein